MAGKDYFVLSKRKHVVTQCRKISIIIIITTMLICVRTRIYYCFYKREQYYYIIPSKTMTGIVHY